MLFKTNATLLQFAELASDIQFNSVRSTINLVEQQHIAPILGNTLFNSLNQAYTAAADESALTDVEKTLLEKCRFVIGPLVCYYYLPKAEVKLGGAGAQRIESDSNKTAYQNQVINFREQMLREGGMATETLLQFLDENKDDYPDWLTSTGYQDYKDLFIKSGSEFQGLFSSHSPYRNYMAMRGHMKDVEQNSIRTLLGDQLFNHLKEIDQSADPSFSETEKDLLQKVKKVIAYLTVATSIPFLNVRVDINGLTVMNSTSAQNDQQAKRSAASDKALDALINACNAAAKSWINNVTTFLEDNAAAFADYLPQPAAADEDPRNGDDDNDDVCLNGSFGLT